MARLLQGTQELPKNAPKQEMNDNGTFYFDADMNLTDYEHAIFAKIFRKGERPVFVLVRSK